MIDLSPRANYLALLAYMRFWVLILVILCALKYFVPVKPDKAWVNFVTQSTWFIGLRLFYGRRYMVWDHYLEAAE